MRNIAEQNCATLLFPWPNGFSFNFTYFVVREQRRKNWRKIREIVRNGVLKPRATQLSCSETRVALFRSGEIWINGINSRRMISGERVAPVSITRSLLKRFKRSCAVYIHVSQTRSIMQPLASRAKRTLDLLHNLILPARPLERS